MRERILLKEYEENGVRVLIDHDAKTATVSADGDTLCFGLERLETVADLLLGAVVSEGLR